MTVEPFTEEVGSRVPLSTRILEIFQLFFTTTLIDLIVEQTNRYASQVMDPTHYEKWTKVTAEEILAYFGFMLLMGINHLPSLADYWKLDPTYGNGPVADRITRDWFMEISSFRGQYHSCP